MPRLPRAVALLAATLLWLPATAGAVPGFPSTTTFRVDAQLGGTGSLATPVNLAQASRRSVSADGTKIAFSSASDGLSTEDDDRVSNVFVRDRTSGTVTFVSRATGASGAPASVGSFSPSISDDGTRVTFSTQSALDPADTNGAADVYVRDLVAQTTTLVSRAAPGGPVGDGPSFAGQISGDGTTVVFASNAKNLDPADPNATPDVYRVVLGGPAQLVSRANGDNGAVGNGASDFPSVSDDGSVIAFGSSSSNLGPADANNAADVYVRDVGANPDTTVLASAPDQATTATGNGNSERPAISGDGTRVAFESRASNLGDGDLDSTIDVHRRTIGTQTTTLISRATGVGGAKGNGESTDAAISDDGLTVAFRSQATNLDPAKTTAGGVYVRRTGSSTTVLGSRLDGASGAAIDVPAFTPVLNDANTASAQVVVFQAKGGLDPDVPDALPSQVYLRTFDAAQDLVAVSRGPGGAPFANDGGTTTISRGAVSADGRYVALVGTLPAYGFRGQQVWRRDLVSGTVVLVSRPDGLGSLPVPGQFGDATISADGSRVAFSSSVGYDPGDTDTQKSQVYVRDIPAGTTTWASRADGSAGAEPNRPATDPSISGDGRRVAFQSDATNLGDGATNGNQHIHVRDLVTGQTLLASRADGADGAQGGGNQYQPRLSDDGTRVAFESSSANLADGDDDTSDDVHVRDLAAGRTMLASKSSGGVKGDGGSNQLDLSGDGRRVVFNSSATNLDPRDSSGTDSVYVHDLVTGDTRVLSLRADGTELTDSTEEPSIGRDGSVVAFQTQDPVLSGGATTDQLYVVPSDGSAAPRLVSRLDGAQGLPWSRDIDTGIVSGDGSCALWSGDVDERLDGPSDYPGVFARAAGGECPRVEPDTTITEVAADAGGGKRRFAFVSTEDGSSFACSVDGAAETACTSPFTSAALAAGAHTFAVRAVDPGGVADPTPAAAAFTVTAAGGVIVTPTPPQGTKPRITKVTIGRVRAGRKATIRLRLNVAAAVRVTVERRSGKRYRKLGTLKAVRAKAGAVRITLPAKVRGKRLRKGTHRISIVATSGTLRSATVRKTFIVR